MRIIYDDKIIFERVKASDIVDTHGRYGIKIGGASHIHHAAQLVRSEEVSHTTCARPQDCKIWN